MNVVFSKKTTEFGFVPRGREGYSAKVLVGVCGPNLETGTLFQTKICYLPYPISDLSEKSIPDFRPPKLVHGSNI